jgi:outer membrane assembly lipoprotein YfiO
MIKRSAFIIILFSLVGITALSGVANAYWVWTPETKKFINPKYAVKDSPKEQFDWAMSFYDTKDFQRAATEFEKLAKQYEFSEYASKAQYYVGLCYENMSKYYSAYLNYQKAIDNFPHIANTEEILAREFAIGNLYLSKPGPKVLGTDIMAPLDRAVEIFKKVVENAPYGKFAEESQFKLGEALKKSERYEEAVQAFHKVVEDYPKSKLVTKAMYEESNCAYKASLKPAYDASATDNAIKTFEKFVKTNKDADLAKSADTTMKRLKDNVSEKSFKAAEFYESQGKIQAAIIYYQDVIDTYPDSIFVPKSQAKIEMLKARGTKKAAALIDATKKKSERVAREKKPWSPFKFNTGKPSGAAKETSKKSPWNLFNIGAKKEPAVSQKGLESPVVSEAPVEPLETQGAEAVKAETPAAETTTTETTTTETTTTETTTTETQDDQTIEEVPVMVTQYDEAVEKETTSPVETPAAETQKNTEAAIAESAELVSQNKEAASSSVQEEPKREAWRPLNFDNKKDPIVKEAAKNKGWKPLYFGTNDEPMAATNRRW